MILKNSITLNNIIQYKKDWININKKKIPFKKFQHLIKKSKKDFYNKISNKNKFFILECKRSSPTHGQICKNFNLNKISKIYKKYATIISVLTDEKYFDGKFEFLKKVSKIVSQPLLCKDFIIDPWQIYLARLYNADAILLMLSILDDNTYLNLSHLAHSLKMGIITEINNKEEIYRAITLKAKVIGINNRNFENFSIDLNRTITLAPLIPKKIIVISESGINNHSQIKLLSKYVNGFLIGSYLMSQKKIEISTKKLIFGENKICGLNYFSDSYAAYKAGSVYGGLIFIQNSPRCINLNQALYIVKNNKKLEYVGVFCNAPIQKIVYIVKFLRLKFIQLHGQEDFIYIKKLYKLLSNHCVIWKALNMKFEYIKFNYCLSNKLLHRLVLDSGGGTGSTFDWSLINKKYSNKIILSGGLSLLNCKKASLLGCIGLDFNSGLEYLPGVKDHNKIFHMFKILREY